MLWGICTFLLNRPWARTVSVLCGKQRQEEVSRRPKGVHPGSVVLVGRVELASKGRHRSRSCSGKEAASVRVKMRK